MKLFRNIFYRFYQLMISVGNGVVAEYYAILLMAMTLGLNFYTLISISYLLGFKIELGLNTGLKIGIYYFLLTSLLYFSFVHKNKFIEISKYYKNETKKEEGKGKVFIISYFILSIGMMIVCLYLMMKQNRGSI